MAKVRLFWRRQRLVELFLLLALLLCSPKPSSAFLGATCVGKRTLRTCSSGQQFGKLFSSNIFDDIRNFFDDMSGNKDDHEDDEDELAAGTSRVISIPVESIKPGGLRLFLMLYLMGMQNTPDPRSWRADQPSTDDYVLDYWYHDQSAILTITLLEDRITVDRTGSNPSTAYLMQETVILQGILDELHQCAFDESVSEPDRLLILPAPKDGIDKARDSLSFG